MAVVVAVSLVTGCSGRPALQDVEPAMTSAVRVVTGPEADVRRELSSRCGPTDEQLDGLVLRLVADVPPRPVDVDDMAAELRRTGLDVEVGDGSVAPLLAVGSDDGWVADLWPGEHGAWRVTGTAEVDADPEDARAPARPCG